MNDTDATATTSKQPARRAALPRTRRGRPASGQLELRTSGYYVRLTVTVDGERIRKWFALDTHDKAVANRKKARLSKSGEQGTLNVHSTATEAKRVETYAEAAARIRAQRMLDGLRDVSGEEIRDRLYLVPAIGPMLVTEVRPSHIRCVLEEAAEAGKSAKTLAHIRGAAHIVFDSLWRDEIIGDNPVARTPRVRGKQDKRERAVLTDEELAIYLAWEHPEERRRVGALQRQAMSAVSRCFGGLRAGDCHSLRWESIDAPNFAFGWAPRKKTERPQKLPIPAVIRPLLLRWWDVWQRPLTGLVFPNLTGSGAGVEPKGRLSHARALRQDLMHAFGLDRCEGGKWIEVVPVEQYTPRQRELFANGEYTKRVDFHSWRRAFNQALADAGVNAQQAAALAGHSSLEVHSRYLQNTARMQPMPEAALPMFAFSARPPAVNAGDESESQVVTGVFITPPSGDSPSTSSPCQSRDSTLLCRAASPSRA